MRLSEAGRRMEARVGSGLRCRGLRPRGHVVSRHSVAVEYPVCVSSIEARGRKPPVGLGAPDPAACTTRRALGRRVLATGGEVRGGVNVEGGYIKKLRTGFCGHEAGPQRLAMGDPERLSLPPSLKILESVPWASVPLSPL